MIATLLRNYMKIRFVQLVLKLLASKKGNLLKGGIPVAIATFVLEELFNKAWRDKSNKAKVKK